MDLLRITNSGCTHTHTKAITCISRACSAFPTTGLTTLHCSPLPCIPYAHGFDATLCTDTAAAHPCSPRPLPAHAARRPSAPRLQQPTYTHTYTQLPAATLLLLLLPQQQQRGAGWVWVALARCQKQAAVSSSSQSGPDHCAQKALGVSPGPQLVIAVHNAQCMGRWGCHQPCDMGGALTAVVISKPLGDQTHRHCHTQQGVAGAPHSSHHHRAPRHSGIHTTEGATAAWTTTSICQTTPHT
jgi:hypothetical protein